MELEAGATLRIRQASNDFDSTVSWMLRDDCPREAGQHCVDDPDTETARMSHARGAKASTKAWFVLQGYGADYGSYTITWDVLRPGQTYRPTPKPTRSPTGSPTVPTQSPTAGARPGGGVGGGLDSLARERLARWTAQAVGWTAAQAATTHTRACA